MSAQVVVVERIGNGFLVSAGGERRYARTGDEVLAGVRDALSREPKDEFSLLLERMADVLGMDREVFQEKLRRMVAL